MNFTFVTNNARDFRKLYAKEELHAGLVIIVTQVLPVRQRELFDAVLADLDVEAMKVVHPGFGCEVGVAKHQS